MISRHQPVKDGFLETQPSNATEEMSTCRRFLFSEKKRSVGKSEVSKGGGRKHHQAIGVYWSMKCTGPPSIG